MTDDLIQFLNARLDDEQADLDPYLCDPWEGLSDDEKHQKRVHRAFEYRTTEGQRKAWRYVDDPPEGDGWELNITSIDPDAFERFDYTEERYWRRLRPEGERVWKPSPTYVRRAADVAAKRQIIMLHVPANPDQKPEEGVPGWPDKPWFYCNTCGSGERYSYPTEWPCKTLRLMALPYADHPDYRAEWKP